MEIAKEESMPPYIIFSDKSLIDMCVRVPQNEQEMLNVSGVGAAKYKKYGQRFLDEINSYQMIHPDTITSIHEEDETTPVVYEKAKTRKRKGEFYISESDA